MLERLSPLLCDQTMWAGRMTGEGGGVESREGKREGDGREGGEGRRGEREVKRG